MADNPPISTSAPETVTVDLGVDKEQLGNLNEAFDDFWKEADKKAEAPEAPAAPTEGPAQETREIKIERPELKQPETKPPQAETKQAPVETRVPIKEFTDDEINKLELAPNARPELVEQFKLVKDNWMAERAKGRELAKERDTLGAQLAEARQNAWTPELKADYEHASSFRRRYDVAADPEFLRRYVAPVRAQYEAILDEAIGMLPDRQSATEWANFMKANYQPDSLTRDWWTQSVVNKVPNELDRSTLLNSISQLVRLQKERDGEINRCTQDKSSFDNYMQERVRFTQERVQQEIMAEIAEQEKRPEIQEILARDPSRAKTTEERRAIEAHNEQFTKLNTFFQNTVKDISANGPRAWVRAGVEATKAMLLQGRVGELEGELKSLKAERDQLKGDLDKITGARRKITHTSGTPPSTPEKRNNSQGLSIKDLDVRKAFDSFDWGDRT